MTGCRLGPNERTSNALTGSTWRSRRAMGEGSLGVRAVLQDPIGEVGDDIDLVVIADHESVSRRGDRHADVDLDRPRAASVWRWLTRKFVRDAPESSLWIAAFWANAVTAAGVYVSTPPVTPTTLYTWSWPPIERTSPACNAAVPR